MCSAIQPAPVDPTCVHKAAKPCFVPDCTRSRSSFEHFFPNRPYFGGIFGKKRSKVASAVRGRRQTRPLGLSVCVCCVNCHDLVCLRQRRSVIFSLADFACKQSVNTCIAGWSSLVARRAHNPKVVGSNPAPATKTSGRTIVRPFFLPKSGFSGQIRAIGGKSGWRGCRRSCSGWGVCNRRHPPPQPRGGKRGASLLALRGHARLALPISLRAAGPKVVDILLT